MLAALFYGKEGVSTVSIEELEKKDTNLKNDYMCTLSFKFK